MEKNRVVAAVAGALLAMICTLLGPSEVVRPVLAESGNKNAAAAANAWVLPQGVAVKDRGPRTYRFTVDYNTANTKGEMMIRHRLVGEYTRGLPGGEVVWKNVSQAEALGAEAPFGAGDTRDFMEGFRYVNHVEDTLKPDFFKGFPPTAAYERNLVWDTGMIETFGQNYFQHLKLNEPYRFTSKDELTLPDLGTFENRDVLLEWVGRGKRNGEDCALINYQAFFNPLKIATGGVNLTGRSDYWGQIWVSLSTKQIEYATLNEVVVGELKLPGQENAQVVNIFRSGVFEPVSGK